jgi:phage tail-like protein
MTEEQAAKIKDGIPSCRFYVSFGDVPNAVFTELSGLAMELVVEDVEEGGTNDFVHRLPGRCKVSNITLKRGMTTSNEFLSWIFGMAQGTIKRRNVTVSLFLPNGTDAVQWSFANAYPVKWTGPQFKSDDTAVAIETVELAHDGMTVKGTGGK